MATPPSQPQGSGSGASAGTKAAPSAVAKPAPRPIPPFLAPLRYMGIPSSVLSWQPRLPSRNWSIFILATSTLTSLYLYDRRECKRIRQEYVERVQHLAQEPLAPKDWPRKVSVFAARAPGDDDVENSIVWFKKYVKPILVAAAVDWDTLNGTQHGGLARELVTRIHARRRQLAGLEPWPIFKGTHSSTAVLPDDVRDKQAAMDPPPFALTPQQQLQREIEGATVIVGRPALKEWMWALREGWTTVLPPRAVDRDEQLAELLAKDGAFDEAAPAGDKAASQPPLDDTPEEDGAGAPLPSRFGAGGPGSLNPAFSMLSQPRISPTNSTSTTAAPPSVPAHLLAPPSTIPAQPPLVFIDHRARPGWRNVPVRLVGFFNHRERVRAGGEDALRIALGITRSAREFDAPPGAAGEWDEWASRRAREEPYTHAHSVPIGEDQPGRPATPPPPPQGGDLDWGLEAEASYPPRWTKVPSIIAEQRKSYYETDLPARLKATRELTRGERQPSYSERDGKGGTNVKSEGELREDRLKREREWRGQLEGYDILGPQSGVAWSEAFRGALRVHQVVREEEGAGWGAREAGL